LNFTTELLDPAHSAAAFTCGITELDNWLRNYANQAQRSGTARTWVWLQNGTAIAYYALAPHKAIRDEMQKAVAHGAPTEIPAILLAKLALDTSLHGQGLGGALLADALTIATNAMRKVGGRLIVVDAIDDSAASFYIAHGFKAIPNNPHRLTMKASTAAMSLGIDWP
jgi:GNAT superfamily N-acetyltransferase